ncbi:hypothetical protein GCM10010428_56640 [Actinosynnema pretiosum subsp. pretiosum]
MVGSQAPSVSSICPAIVVALTHDPALMLLQSPLGVELVLDLRVDGLALELLGAALDAEVGVELAATGEAVLGESSRVSANTPQPAPPSSSTATTIPIATAGPLFFFGGTPPPPG